MIGQLLIAQPIIAIVLGKAAIFHCGLNGYRVDDKKSILLDFSFSWFFFKGEGGRQEIVTAEENEKEVLSVADNGRETDAVSLGAAV